jgi:hypothetical protein
MVDQQSTNNIPSRSRKVKYLIRNQPEHHQHHHQSPLAITITYNITSSNRTTMTNALIAIDSVPFAPTSFKTPDHRNNTFSRTTHMDASPPLLLCSTEVPKPLHEYGIKLYCNTKKIYTKIRHTRLTNTSPTYRYGPEWDLLNTIVHTANRFRTSQFIDGTK